MDCPQPDTRNRYEGRGSGDRIARLKANATREGPKPTNQNSASWNLTKQQGCCTPVCINECLPPDYEILGESVNGYYEINGELSGDIIIFNIAQMKEPNCTATLDCTPNISFDNDNIYPTDVTEFIGNAYACDVPISLQMQVSSYGIQVSTDDITVIFSTTTNICQSGLGGTVTIRLKLIYNAVLSDEELIAAARSLADNAANRAVNAAAAAATSAAGALVVATTAANNGNVNLTQIQAAFTAASNAYNASFAASNSAIAAAAVAATATTVGAATTAANNAIQQADIAESQSAIAAEQAAIASSLL